MSVPTWMVWSVAPPECMEKISTTSMLDAARSWAERQFRKGFVARNGTEVLVCAENDPNPRQSAYRVKLTIVNAPAFRASFAGIAFEGMSADPSKGDRRG